MSAGRRYRQVVWLADRRVLPGERDGLAAITPLRRAGSAAAAAEVMRRRMVLQEASEAAEWLRMVNGGECPVESGICEAQRSINMAVDEMMRGAVS